MSQKSLAAKGMNLRREALQLRVGARGESAVTREFLKKLPFGPNVKSNIRLLFSNESKRKRKLQEKIFTLREIVTQDWRKLQQECKGFGDESLFCLVEALASIGLRFGMTSAELEEAFGPPDPKK